MRFSPLLRCAAACAVVESAPAAKPSAVHQVDQAARDLARDVGYLKRYLLLGCAYGFVRGIIRTQDATLQSRTDWDKQVPMLTTQRCGVVLASAMFGIYGMPFMAWKDVRAAEAMLRGRTPAEYGLDYSARSSLDYVFG